ncbi:28S ribosomal mitochondrial [Brachionus plicatilis]|uniref:Small ribosomal subunit protein mS29 n=1 Tax=Brachionus plicatilis TaxID=10195 RepID=A0A3M7PPP7_BRAPC|nr:28S ribosomal mitochondrial [Brachionus plicatilis]
MNTIRNIRKVLPILSFSRNSIARSANIPKPNLYLSPIQSSLYSTDQEIKVEIKQNRSVPHVYRCSVNDPIKHNVNNLSKFYRLDQAELNVIDPFQECLNREQYAEFKAFDETCLMIRQPGVEIINYLKNLDLSLPAYRFVLYGTQNGTGKRSTLLHILHYCHKDNWLLFHVPNCSAVLRKAKENQPSSYKEGRLDTPIDAALFLKRFSIQNMKLLKELDLKTTKKYDWSKRESSPEGTPILELIDYANSRIKYSSDICGAIVREIKLQSESNRYKVFVAIEQINSYFGPTRLKRPDKSEINVDDITIVRNFKKLLKNDWKNAAVVGTICSRGVIIPAPNRRTKFYDVTIPIANRRRAEHTLEYEGPLTPAHLLKKEGFYHLEPFVPIEIPAYSDLEILNHYEYYKDRNWLQNEDALTDSGKEELKFLSGKNPREFMRICRAI